MRTMMMELTELMELMHMIFTKVASMKFIVLFTVWVQKLANQILFFNQNN